MEFKYQDAEMAVKDINNYLKDKRSGRNFSVIDVGGSAKPADNCDVLLDFVTPKGAGDKKFFRGERSIRVC